MKMKYLLFIISCLFLLDPVFAQTSIQAGFSAGFNLQSFTAEDDRGYLQPGNGMAATLGVPIIITKDKWSLQTGFFSNHLTRAYYFQTPGRQYGSAYSYDSGLSSYKIPLIVSRELRPMHSNLGFSPHAGISWLTSRRTGRTGEGSGNMNGLEYTVIGRAFNRNKFLAEIGMDLNYHLSRNFILYGGVTWSFGLQEVEELEISYQLPNEGIQTGFLKSKASGRNFHIGLKIPFYRR